MKNIEEQFLKLDIQNLDPNQEIVKLTEQVCNEQLQKNKNSLNPQIMQQIVTSKQNFQSNCDIQEYEKIQNQIKQQTQDEIKQILKQAQIIVQQQKNIRNGDLTGFQQYTQLNSQQVIDDFVDFGNKTIKEQKKSIVENPMFRKRAFKARVLQFFVLLVPTFFILVTSAIQVNYSGDFLEMLEDKIKNNGQNKKVKVLKEDSDNIHYYGEFLFISVIVFNVYMYAFGCYKSYKQNSQKAEKYFEKQVEMKKEKIKKLSNEMTKQNKLEFTKKLKEQIEKKKDMKKKDKKFHAGLSICIVVIIYAFVGQFISSLIFLTRDYEFDGEYFDLTQNTDFQELEKVTNFIVWQPVYIIPVQGGFLYFLAKYIYKQYEKGQKDQQNKFFNVILNNIQKK